jgi:hypothetical protein
MTGGYDAERRRAQSVSTLGFVYRWRDGLSEEPAMVGWRGSVLGQR